jgi:hypothetical protein
MPGHYGWSFRHQHGDLRAVMGRLDTHCVLA